MPRDKKPAQQHGRACGLCGKTKGLTKTECCGNWICDDEHEYVIFSYARNSCYRNHRRYTLCGFHHEEGHEGRWQDCAECRDAFETEMYVYCGTNAYNFEQLPNPPAYEPTHCQHCGRVISLGEDGYSIAGGEYFCGACTAERLHKKLPHLAGRGVPSPADAVEANSASGEANAAGRGVGDLQELTDAVSDAYRERFVAIVERTDAFCDTYLDADYKALCREMAAALCQTGSPVNRGKPDSWAAGVVYALGRVNFLTDPSQTPHMKSPDIAKGFGVSVATMQAKAKVIREGLDLMPFHPDWTLPDQMKSNPLIWLLEVNGVPVDIRDAPREAQVVAYNQGLIPYIPADHER